LVIIEGFAKDAIMNILEHIKEGDTTFRISGTFGQNKTVTINQFGDVTYLHLRRPNGQKGIHRLGIIASFAKPSIKRSI
jgi:hypothetical protein